MFEQARIFRDEHTYTATTLQQLEQGVQTGFVRAAWCGCRECEDKVKELYNASTRNMPFDQSDMPSDKCVDVRKARDQGHLLCQGVLTGRGLLLRTHSRRERDWI